MVERLVDTLRGIYTIWLKRFCDIILHSHKMGTPFVILAGQYYIDLHAYAVIIFGKLRRP